MNIFKELISCVYPNTCVGCKEIIPEDEFLCEYCMCMIEKTEITDFCIKCGNRKKNCNCSKQVFFYDGCFSPLYNNGIAKKVMFAYKFRHKEMFSEFFASQMALAVRQAFYDIDFDVVCCVPMETARSLRRGYNQSEILAGKLSALLDIPFCAGAIGKHKSFKRQHNTPFKERFENVKNKYFVKIPLENKTVLLVDDIKTSGATLSECAKQLVSCGADRVYCITALTTDKKGKKNGN